MFLGGGGVIPKYGTIKKIWHSAVPNFTLIRQMSRPCGAKHLKIAT